MIEFVSRQTVQLVKEKDVAFSSDEMLCNSPDNAVEVIRRVTDIDKAPKEHLVVLTLDTKLKAIGCHVVHIGTVNQSIVHPRDVFQIALLDNASHIVIAHNHPSGDVTPSDADFQVTKRIDEAGKMIGIDLLDHFIVTDEAYFSFKDKGYLL